MNVIITSLYNCQIKLLNVIFGKNDKNVHVLANIPRYTVHHITHKSNCVCDPVLSVM